MDWELVFYLTIFGLIVLGAIAFFIWLVIDAYFPKCPKCGKRRVKHLGEEIVPSTNKKYLKSGFDLYRCKACGYEYKRPFSIETPHSKTDEEKEKEINIFGDFFGGRQEDDSSSSSGRSWGGGSSSGGGAGAKW